VLHIHLNTATICFCHEKLFLTFEVNLLFYSEERPFPWKCSKVEILGTVVANDYCIKTNYKTNEMRRTLAVLLFTGTSLSNGEVLQATEGFFSSSIREILFVV